MCSGDGEVVVKGCNRNRHSWGGVKVFSNTHSGNRGRELGSMSENCAFGEVTQGSMQGPIILFGRVRIEYFQFSEDRAMHTLK